MDVDMEVDVDTPDVVPMTPPSAPPSAEPICSECEAAAAVYRCADCSRNGGVALFLCADEACYEATHGRVTKATHRTSLVPWDAEDFIEVHCSHHHGYVLHYQCTEEGCDGELVCLRCEKDGRHTGHRLNDIQEIQDGLRRGLKTESERLDVELKLAHHHRRRLQEHRSALEDETQQEALLAAIAKDFSDIRDVLQCKEEAMTLQVKHLSATRRQQAVQEMYDLDDYVQTAGELRARIASVCSRDASQAQRVVIEERCLSGALANLSRPVPTVYPEVGYSNDVSKVCEAISKGVTLLGMTCRGTEGTCHAQYTPCGGCDAVGCAECMDECTLCTTAVCKPCYTPCKNCAKMICKSCAFDCVACNVHGCMHCMAIKNGEDVNCRKCGTVS